MWHARHDRVMPTAPQAQKEPITMSLGWLTCAGRGIMLRQTTRQWEQRGRQQQWGAPMLVQGIPTQSTLRFWLSWDQSTVPSAWLNTGQPLTPVPLRYNERQVAVLLTAVNLIPNT